MPEESGLCGSVTSASGAGNGGESRSPHINQRRGKIQMHNRSMTSAVKGMAIGMVTGAAAYVVGSKVIGTDKRKIKKNMNKTVKAVGNVIDNIGYMMKS